MARGYSRWRTAERMAWKRVGWVLWPVFVFGPIVALLAVLGGGWALVAWVAARIPAGWHSEAAVAAIGLLVAGVVGYRAAARRWGARALATWALVAGAVVLLGAAAYAAAGG